MARIMERKVEHILIILCFFALVAGEVACEKKPDESKGTEPAVSLRVSNQIPTEVITVAGVPFTVELAYTQKTRLRGLMFRKELAADKGMLFVFKRIRMRSFYMKNCLIDMDILFIKSNGQIARIHNMKIPVPGKPLVYYSSDTPIKYALELPAGTAEKLEIRPGQKIKIPQRVAGIIAEPD